MGQPRAHASQVWKEVYTLLVPTLTLCPRGRFRILGTERHGELSDRERCGAILSQVLGAESPLCHLGATQVGVCAEAQAQLERERSILGQTQDLVVLLGGWEMEWVWVTGALGTPGE